MSIKIKIILIVLPIVIVILILSGMFSFMSASTGISRIAKDFLGFKTSELEKYTKSQWNLLVENNFSDRPDMITAAQSGIQQFATSIIRSETELITAFNSFADPAISTGEIKVLEKEKKDIISLYNTKATDLVNISIGGIERVGKGFYFEPFQWYIMVTEQKNTFYKDVNQITYQTIVILVVSSVIFIFMLMLLANYLINPLTKVVKTMKDIISYNDLSERVHVEFSDETGALAHTFNIMVGELEKAYNQIKKFAFNAVVAEKKEKKIRQIFQKYVPQDLIDKFFQNPESMLVGDNRVISILFSDIRSFTTISEGMMPDELVNSLNKYFNIMVDIIMNRNGIVDKYIGDAIMAFFGAPVKHDDDALNSVLSGIEMTESVKDFNKSQLAIGKPEFKIGVGINYGIATVGNIGSERKMDYTVIGDMVNLASRLEGLTKKYHQELLISESLQMKIKDTLPWRLIDAVAVKGKTEGVRIYTAKKQLNEKEKEIWGIHNEAMEKYFKREFKEAENIFKKVLSIEKEDFTAATMLARCEEYIKNPPPADWDGVEIMHEK